MKAEETADAIRADLKSRRESGTTRGVGYPPAVRDRVIAYATECQVRGESMTTIASRLAMSHATLTLWMAGPNAKRKLRRATPAFAPVSVTAAAAPRRVILISPTGWKAEIDLESFAKLLASLK